MNRRQRVLEAIRHRRTDFVPYNLHATGAVYSRLCLHYGLADTNALLEFAGNHLAKIGGDFNYDPWAEKLIDLTPTSGHARLDSDGRQRWHTDEFGCVWDRSHSGAFPVRYPLHDDHRGLARYRFPDPDRPGRFDGYQAAADRYRGRLFLFGKLGFSLFERAWTIRGFDQLLIDMIERPEFVEALLDRVLYEWTLPVVDRLLAFGVDGFYFTDDWGSQTGLLFSVPMWRRFIKPRLALCYQRVKASGACVAQHSDGNIFALMPDLIEIGLDIFNPVSPSVYPPDRIKEQWGDRITLFGGIDVETTLPFGTPADVRAEVLSRADALGRGGGYILQSSHTMLEDIPLENLVAYIEACHELAGVDTAQALAQARQPAGQPA